MACSSMSIRPGDFPGAMPELPQRGWVPQASPGGRIADLLSRRRVLITGLAVFTTASLISGFASTAGVLIGARAAQGLGAALMTPAALAIIMATYAGAQRAKGLAMWGAADGLGIAAGVVVGGVITTFVVSGCPPHRSMPDSPRTCSRAY